eukprot:12414820-Prorocentrum_lima.AAC.1
MTSSLVGSEMCIRDRSMTQWKENQRDEAPPCQEGGSARDNQAGQRYLSCLLYTSDAADDM